jgi:hypothetical protein
MWLIVFYSSLSLAKKHYRDESTTQVVQCKGTNWNAFTEAIQTYCSTRPKNGGCIDGSFEKAFTTCRYDDDGEKKHTTVEFTTFASGDTLISTTIGQCFIKFVKSGDTWKVDSVIYECSA